MELLRYFSSKVTEKRIAYWIQYYDLQNLKTLNTGIYPWEQSKKMALIQAFISSPSILFLDEPMNALDEKSVRLTKQVILSYLKKRKWSGYPDVAHIGRYFRPLYRCISCRNGHIQYVKDIQSRRWLMAHLKSFITRYSKVYIGLVLLIWIAFFFLPWGSPILGGED